MITSFIDLGGAALLWVAGLYYLHLSRARALRGRGRWRDDVSALLVSLLGAVLFAMGLLLCAYSIGFAVISAGILSR